jgi:hypothetical protein
MAQRVQVLLVCDLHGDDTPGEETITFGLDGASYELDACAGHARVVREAFAPFVAAGRRTGAGASRRRSSRPRRGSTGDRSADIRAWARDRGITVSSRGRIPGWLSEQYEAADRG